MVTSRGCARAFGLVFFLFVVANLKKETRARRSKATQSELNVATSYCTKMHGDAKQGCRVDFLGVELKPEGDPIRQAVKYEDGTSSSNN